MTRETLVMSCGYDFEQASCMSRCRTVHLELGEGEDGQDGDSLLACTILAERDIKSTNHRKPFDLLQLCMVHLRPPKILLAVCRIGEVRRVRRV